MPSLQTQFHAQPDELLVFCYNSARKYDLQCCILAGHPSTPVIINSFEQLLLLYRDFISSASKFDFRFLILQNSLGLQGTNNNNFGEKHPDTIWITIGQLNDCGLEESHFSFVSDNEITYKTAKKISNDLKKITYAGATASNKHGSAFYRTHRYTEKAKQLNLDGYVMRSLGSAVFDFNTK